MSVGIVADAALHHEPVKTTMLSNSLRTFRRISTFTLLSENRCRTVGMPDNYLLSAITLDIRANWAFNCQTALTTTRVVSSLGAVPLRKRATSSRTAD